MIPYITVNDAEDYFLTRLNSDPWDDSTETDKYKALCTATRLIDNLAFSGIKAYSNQENQFPRLGQLDIPTDIKIATCELALQLLDGADPNFEVESIQSESSGFGAVRSTYNRSFVLEHVRAGIPSLEAWNILLKYLVDSKSLIIRRI